MSSRTVALGALATVLACSCGYVGIDLRELPSTGDGGAPVDASAEDAELDARTLDASGDAAHELDASEVDASSEDASLTDASRTDASPDAALTDASLADAGGIACDLGGSWAVRVRLPISWPGGALQAGLDNAVIWLRYQGTQAGSSWSGSAQPCGITLPDFRLNPLVANETYALRVPDTLFDHTPAYLSPIPSSMTIGGSSSVGDSVAIAPAGNVIGATLANPVTDAWPADHTTLQSVDTDMNGQPGITANYVTDATHVGPPLNLSRTQRAASSYVAVRLAFSAGGSITTCSALDGPITFSHFDTHILGCAVAGGGACNATLTDFLDDNRPVYSPNAATYHAIKVDPGTTCAQVRTMLPP